MSRIPFSERLWCSVEETCQVTGEGRTVIFAKISSGEIVSKLEGRRRLVHVQSLIARYDKCSSQLESKSLADTQVAAGAAKKRG